MTTIKGPGNLGGTVSVSENHVNYESRADAVYLNIDGRNRYDGTKFFTLSVENARELAAELTKIADRFDLNKPKPPTRAEQIKAMAIGTTFKTQDTTYVKVAEGKLLKTEGLSGVGTVRDTESHLSGEKYGAKNDIEILFDPNGGK